MSSCRVSSLMGAVVVLLCLSPAATAKGNIQVVAVPTELILCPGEEGTITLYVEKKVRIGGKERWVKAGGVPVEFARLQEGADGGVAIGGDPYKTGDQTGSFSIPLKAAARAGTVEHFSFYLFDPPGSKLLDNIVSHAYVTVITLSAEDCAKLRAEKEDPCPTLEDFRKKVKDTCECPPGADLKARLGELSGSLKNAKAGKRFNPARTAALREIDALLKDTPNAISPGDLGHTLAAVRAKSHDILERVGKLYRVTDPSRAWFADLKTKSVDELAALLLQCEAANDTHLRAVLRKLGSPPDFTKGHLPLPVAVIESQGRYEGVPLLLTANRKEMRIVRVGPAPGGTAFRGLYLIEQELISRRPGTKDAPARKRLEELITHAHAGYNRHRVGESLTSYQGTYLERKAAGDSTGAEDIRTRYLDRFFKELEMRFREKDSPSKK